MGNGGAGEILPEFDMTCAVSNEPMQFEAISYRVYGRTATNGWLIGEGRGEEMEHTNRTRSRLQSTAARIVPRRYEEVN